MLTIEIHLNQHGTQVLGEKIIRSVRSKFLLTGWPESKCLMFLGDRMYVQTA